MKVITTNRLNRFWKNGVKPIKDALANKLDSAKVINSLLTTAAGYALDARQGKVLNDSITELNNNMTANDCADSDKVTLKSPTYQNPTLYTCPKDGYLVVNQMYNVNAYVIVQAVTPSGAYIGLHNVTNIQGEGNVTHAYYVKKGMTVRLNLMNNVTNAYQRYTFYPLS